MITKTLCEPSQHLPSLGRLADLASHTFCLDDLDWTSPIDRSKWFVCPTLTPLYYTPVYSDLSREHRLYYNQLFALYQSELIAYFEISFSERTLTVIREHPRITEYDDLDRCLSHFVQEERKHIQMWRMLNRTAAPAWYESTDNYIVQIPRAARRVMEFLTCRPNLFPVMLWITLAMEERSLEISRRCINMSPAEIEPLFAAVFRAHLIDEGRHVQIDRHLLQCFYFDRSKALRYINARLLRFMLGNFFLTPYRSAMRVVTLLVRQYPEIRHLLPRLMREQRVLDRNMDYQRMMYSRTVTPILFSLFDEFPEYAAMGRVLKAYTPAVA